MAHGYLQYFGGEKVEVYGAGIETHGVNPFAIGVMAEDGIDISKHTSNLIDDYMGIEFDLVFTVCDHAKETCPYFPSTAKTIHHSFSDPSKESGTANDLLMAFRQTRDEIKVFSRRIMTDVMNLL